MKKESGMLEDANGPADESSRYKIDGKGNSGTYENVLVWKKERAYSETC